MGTRAGRTVSKYTDFAELPTIMPALLRTRRTVGSAVLSLLVILSFIWLLLYLDSVHQRRKAEQLLSDLKSFPFATAGFVEARDFAIRHGATLVPQFPNIRFLPPGTPRAPLPPQIYPDIPLSYVSEAAGPICTYRNCTIEGLITPFGLTSLIGVPDSLCGSILARIGLRLWRVGTTFEVKDGKLRSSGAGVMQIMRSRSLPLGSSPVLTFSAIRSSLAFGTYLFWPSGYSVACGKSGFVHAFTNCTGTSDQVMDVWLVQPLLEPSEVPIGRAFNINLRCLTVVSRDCRGLAEIAPSAWSDYQTLLETIRKETRQQ